MVVLVAGGGSGAYAQSILQSLFGFLGGDGPKAQPPGARVLAPPIVQPPHRNQPLTYAPYTAQPLPPPRQSALGASPVNETRYRSLCVRTCDGFYFPVSYGVERSGLYKDQKSCEARCGGVGELYFYPVNGGSVDTATNFAGRPYKRLATAFRYRKEMVSGCACKPAPWTTTEARRHERYAHEEALEAGKAGVGSARTLGPRGAEAAVILTSGEPDDLPALPQRPSAPRNADSSAAP